MNKVVEFPDKKGERERYFAKLDVTKGCLEPMAHCIQAMREIGADSKQIARILRHAATELEGGDAS